MTAMVDGGMDGSGMLMLRIVEVGSVRAALHRAALFCPQVSAMCPGSVES